MAKKQIGYYVEIDFTPEAKRFVAPGSFNKRIIHKYNDIVIAIEPYNPVKEKFLKRRDVIIIDKTIGVTYPVDASEVPLVEQALGVIELRRRLT